MGLQDGRNVILTTDDDFPADLYIAQGVYEVKYITADTVYEHIDEAVEALMLTYVHYSYTSTGNNLLIS